jgi:hypothetical protein
MAVFSMEDREAMLRYISLLETENISERETISNNLLMSCPVSGLPDDTASGLPSMG